MKVRKSFVSNSSSCSFVIYVGNISPSEHTKLEELFKSGKILEYIEDGILEYYRDENGDIRDQDEIVHLYKAAENFYEVTGEEVYGQSNGIKDAIIENTEIFYLDIFIGD